MRRLTVRLDDALYDALEARRVKDGVPVNEQIRRALLQTLPLTDSLVDGMVAAAPPPDPERTARIRESFDRKQAEAANQTVPSMGLPRRASLPTGGGVEVVGFTPPPLTAEQQEAEEDRAYEAKRKASLRRAQIAAGDEPDE